MGLTIKGGLYFVFLNFMERFRWRSVFPWLHFVDQTLFRIRFSSASRAHPSQEGLWWTEGSCGQRRRQGGSWRGSSPPLSNQNIDVYFLSYSPTL